MNYLTTARLQKERVKDMCGSSFTHVRNTAGFDGVVADILDDYNFIGTVRRLDESLILLGFLLGLNAADLLYLSSKTNGGYDNMHML